MRARLSISAIMCVCERVWLVRCRGYEGTTVLGCEGAKVQSERKRRCITIEDCYIEGGNVDQDLRRRS